MKKTNPDLNSLLADPSDELEREFLALQQEQEEEVPPDEETESVKEQKDKEEILELLEQAGCPREVVVAFKEKYGSIVVYPYDEHRLFIIRPLKVKDMNMIKAMASKDPGAEETLVFKYGCLFPKIGNLDELPAGIPSLMTNVILRLSGFVDLGTAFRQIREL